MIFSKNGFLLLVKPCRVRFSLLYILGRIFQNSRSAIVKCVRYLSM